MTDQIIEKVADDVGDVIEESNTAQSHNGSEDLFQKRYREGYDIYDEPYVRWLMVHHPGDVKGEWLTEIANTFEADWPPQKTQVAFNMRESLVLYTCVKKKTTKLYHKSRAKKIHFKVFWTSRKPKTPHFFKKSFISPPYFTHILCV